MNSHALAVLEFPEALAEVARLAASTLGAEAVRALRPGVSPADIEPELARVEEMRRLLERDEGWAMPPVPDVRSALALLRVDGSVLEGLALHALGGLLASTHSVRRRLAAADAPPGSVAALAAGLPEWAREEAEIARVLDEAGEVTDAASPLLARLRREIRLHRERLVTRLTAFAAALPAHLQVPDASVSVREGRYVIPVRREGRSEVGGIVHDESGTGATLFVEPPLAVEMMNRLRQTEAEARREELRILRELTELLRPRAEELRGALDALIALDSLYARGRYALRVGGQLPGLLAPGTEEYQVVRGVHPLLLARGEEPVPFHLHMEAGERTLLISGPNTGGKTVLLKAVGLLSLLAQSGVIPPVGPGTRLPVFGRVFADIGDEQSIEASLSTFSAHLRNVGEVLAGADWESLVLIDEIGSGTDPVEGAALARAVLVELTHRSALTLATTHLGQLKLLATDQRGVVNASLQFDAERLRPTYRLLKGVPGRSYGLAIARRLGLPEPLLADAEAALPAGERDTAKLLLALEAAEQRQQKAADELERRLADTERLRAELERREIELRQRERDAERRARQQARDLLLAARQEVEDAIREVRETAPAGAGEEVARAARRRVEEAAERQRERTPRREAERASRAEVPLEVGTRVRIGSLGRTGQVAELRDGRALVQAGDLRVLLPREELEPLPAGDQKTAAERGGRSAGGQGSYAREAHPEVDLRGMRPDEMEHRLARALDDALLAGLPSFRIIHGKGTGVLRARVQEQVQGDPRVASFRAGERFEGGTGVTVVEFA